MRALLVALFALTYSAIAAADPVIVPSRIPLFDSPHGRWIGRIEPETEVNTVQADSGFTEVRIAGYLALKTLPQNAVKDRIVHTVQADFLLDAPNGKQKALFDSHFFVTVIDTAEGFARVAANGWIKPEGFTLAAAEARTGTAAIALKPAAETPAAALNSPPQTETAPARPRVVNARPRGRFSLNWITRSEHWSVTHVRTHSIPDLMGEPETVSKAVSNGYLIGPEISWQENHGGISIRYLFANGNFEPAGKASHSQFGADLYLCDRIRSVRCGMILGYRYVKSSMPESDDPDLFHSYHLSKVMWGPRFDRSPTRTGITFSSSIVFGFPETFALFDSDEKFLKTSGLVEWDLAIGYRHENIPLGWMIGYSGAATSTYLGSESLPFGSKNHYTSDHLMHGVYARIEFSPPVR